MNEGNKPRCNLFAPPGGYLLSLLTLTRPMACVQRRQLSFVPTPHILAILEQVAWENPDAYRRPWVASGDQFQAGL